MFFTALIVGSGIYLSSQVTKGLLLGAVAIGVYSNKKKAERLERLMDLGINPKDEILRSVLERREDPQPEFYYLEIDLEGTLPKSYHTLNGKWLITGEERKILFDSIERLRGFLSGEENKPPPINLFVLQRRSIERLKDPELQELLREAGKNQ